MNNTTTRSHQRGSGLSRYMDEITLKPVLSRKEIVALCEIGDDASIAKIVEHNLRLVISNTKPYVGRGVEIEDLIAEGNRGLFKAAAKFDPSKGTEFSTYATWWINHYINRAVVNQSRTIRVPNYLHETRGRLFVLEGELASEGILNPSDELLAKRLGVPVKRIVDVREFFSGVVSMDQPIGKEGEEGTFADICPDESVDFFSGIEGGRDDVAEKLHCVLASLDDDMRELLNMRFGLDGSEPMTLEAIGEARGVSRNTIVAEMKKALALLRARVIGD